MHGGMQPPEKGGAGLPPPRLRPQPGAPANWWAPPGHRLRAVGSLLDLLCFFGYGWIQFGVEMGFLIIFDCAFLNSSFGFCAFSIMLFSSTWYTIYPAK
jgi:hypothetical protein